MRVRWVCLRLRFVALALLGAPLVPAVAAPGVPAAQNVPQDAAQRAYEALPEAERKAVQDGLIWTGDYKGVVDGQFGKGTRDAISAFARRSNMPDDGTIDGKGRTALAAAAVRAKQAVQFTVQDDARAGLRLGVPLRLLTKIQPTKAGTRYSAADGSLLVETLSQAEPAGGLAEMFEQARADLPGRKVTYKVLRPDFFVVAGENAGRAFYTRMMHRDGAPSTGFTVSYPIANKATFESLTIAVANSFGAMGDTKAAPQASAPALAPKPAPALVSGIAVAPGLVLTILPEVCATPRIRGRAAKLLKRGGDGLALLEVAGLQAPAAVLRPQTVADGGSVTILSAVLADAGVKPDLSVTRGVVRPPDAQGAARVFAAVQGAATGGAVFDSVGALTGLLAAGPRRQLVAGVVPQATHGLVGVDKIAPLVGASSPRSEAVADKTAGEVAAANASTVVAVACD